MSRAYEDVLLLAEVTHYDRARDDLGERARALVVREPLGAPDARGREAADRLELAAALAPEMADRFLLRRARRLGTALEAAAEQPQVGCRSLLFLLSELELTLEEVRRIGDRAAGGRQLDGSLARVHGRSDGKRLALTEQDERPRARQLHAHRARNGRARHRAAGDRRGDRICAGARGDARDPVVGGLGHPDRALRPRRDLAELRDVER